VAEGPPAEASVGRGEHPTASDSTSRAATPGAPQRGRIADGTSYTFAVGERASLFSRTPWAGAVSFGTTRVTPGAPVNHLGAVEESATQTLVHIAVHPLNDRNSDPEDFFSPHPGIGTFLFADGSVRPVRHGVGLAVLQALATRAGGETVNPNDF
jgi:prepilin-type processing-associated H-X9-DG protein